MPAASDIIENHRRKVVARHVAVRVAASLLAISLAVLVALATTMTLWLVEWRKTGVRDAITLFFVAGGFSGAAYLIGTAIRDIVLPRRLAALVSGGDPVLADAIRSARTFAISRGAESVELARAHIEATAKELGARRDLSPSLRPLPELALATAVLFAVIAATWQLTAPRGGDALSWASRALINASETRDAGAASLLADITIRYEYPRYMERGTRTIRGATGDIHAPRGTLVRIEATPLVPTAKVTLELGSQKLEGNVDAAGRIGAGFTVGDDTSYRFVLVSDGDTLRDRPHTIEAEADALPEVSAGPVTRGGEVLSVDDTGDYVVRGDETLAIRWSASDDYGLTQVLLESGALGETRKTATLDEQRSRAASGEQVIELAVLNLRAGDRYALTFVALDNDAVSGPKRGTAEPITLRIFSEAEQRRRIEARAREVWELAVTHLADRLESPLEQLAARPDPTQIDVVASQVTVLQPALNSGSQKLSDAMTALLETALVNETTAKGEPTPLTLAFANFRSALDEVRSREASRLDALARARNNKLASLGTVLSLLATERANVIATLERHVLYLQDLLDKRRLDDLAARMRELDRQRERLSEKLAQLKDKDDPELRAEVLREIDRIRREMGEILAEMAKMRPETEGFVNPDALAEQADQMEDMSQLVRDGRIDEALAELDQMAKVMREMLDGVDDRLEAMGDQYEEGAQKAQELADKLEALKSEQEKLLQQTEAVAGKALDKSAQQMKARADELREKLEGELDRVEAALKSLDDEPLMQPGPSNLQAAQKRANEVREMVRRGDFAEAREAAYELRSQTEMLEWSMPLNDGAGQVQRRMDMAQSGAARVQQELDKALQEPAAQMSESDRRALEELANRQQKLGEDAEQVGREMSELQSQMPSMGPQMGERLGNARGEMRQAQSRLQQRTPGQAGEHQREAANQLSELAQEMRQQGQKGGGMPMPGGASGMPQRGRDGDGREMAREKVAIPNPSEFKASDEFRKDLLDAMKEGSPEGYREQVKNYYRELIR